ncbi:MAG: LacI family DNA-binding transcriptional regulator [Proteobacteria bacterium]|nr:LacI family DNA-binding transcriptional regulator [Pseudomonadota bacterium]
MGSRQVTRLEDLARLAGVSITTVSRALNDSPAVNQQTKQRIWKLAREHDYPFRGYMPSGPTTAAASVAIVIPRPQGREARLSDPFVLELVAGIGEAARQRGCDFVVSHVAPTDYADLTELMATNRLNGIIFLGQSSLHAAFNRLAETETRFAVWGAQMPTQAYCSVGSDNPLGGKRATLHLARLGRRRIVFLGDTEAPEAMQRHQGYLEGLAQAGLAADPQLVVPTHFEIEAGESAVDALIARRITFDGVVAASDLIALGAVRALLRAGRSVPGDVSVVGYDDVSFARYTRPALTTIRQDTALAGRLLVNKLLNAETGGELRSERLPTDLVVRESCGG